MRIGRRRGSVTNVFLGLPDGVVRVRIVNGSGRAEAVLAVPRVAAIAVDPRDGERVYAGTLSDGLFTSTDGGGTWRRRGSGIDRPIISALTVSRSHYVRDAGVVYVGTELSALYRSEDAGDTFAELPALERVPSRGDWSYPPRPNTDHVWSLETDPYDPARIYVGIELGGIIRSEDGGDSFIDSVPGQDMDPHQIRTHPMARGRVYEGGGASFCESRDYGRSWTRDVNAIPDEIRYFYSLAVDPGDPDTIVFSAAHDPFTGHTAVPGTTAWSTLFRRTKDRDWHELTPERGLPPQEGTRMGWLNTDGATSGQLFYTTISGEIYRTLDGGERWERMPVAWPSDATPKVTCTAISTD
jgi:photosystem II stability/assembly factor-like uncharacterized protein